MEPRRASVWILGAAILGVSLLGCGSAPVPSSSPSPIPPALPAEFQVALPPDVIVSVIDQTGAVIAVRPWIPRADDFMPEFDRGRVSAITGPDNFVRVAWLGGQCDTRPVLIISGDTLETQFAVFSGPHPGGVACPDLGVTRGVDLQMTATPEEHVYLYREGSPP